MRNQKATLRLLLSVHDSVVKVEALLLITSTEDVSSSPMKSLRSSQNNDSTSKGRHRQPETQKIERIASEYNQMLYLVEKAQGSQYINALQPVSFAKRHIYEGANPLHSEYNASQKHYITIWLSFSVQRCFPKAFRRMCLAKLPEKRHIPIAKHS